jgi:4-amino-4-deoxy-L-arabinose transferase-like glycosyltransferase
VSASAKIPRPLALLLGVVAIVGIAWALLVPAMQSPDSKTQFAYVESIAMRQALPGSGRRPWSSSEDYADSAVGASRISFWPIARPSWDAAPDREYRAASGRLSRSDGGGRTIESSNPPLYYLYGAIPYLLTVGGDDLDRMYAIRLAGVPLLIALVIAAWLLAGEVLGRIPAAQLVCAGVAGLVPMQTFMSTAVSPDALLVPLWTFALWLGTRVIRRGAAGRDVVALCAVTGAAVLTKSTSYALLPAVLLAVVVGWVRGGRSERGGQRLALALALVAAIAPAVAWPVISNATGNTSYNPLRSSGRHPFSLIHLVSYLWQFYLPRLPGQVAIRPSSGLPLWDIWIREGWGTFGWADVPMPAAVYPVLAAITATIAAAAAAIVARFRDRTRLSLLAFFGLALAGLLAGVHVTEFRFLTTGAGPFVQGRYALPAIGLFGLAVGLLITRLGRDRRGFACAAIFVGLLSLQVIALATVARAYYT